MSFRGVAFGSKSRRLQNKIYLKVHFESVIMNAFSDSAMFNIQIRRPEHKKVEKQQSNKKGQG